MSRVAPAAKLRVQRMLPPARVPGPVQVILPPVRMAPLNFMPATATLGTLMTGDEKPGAPCVTVSPAPGTPVGLQLSGSFHAVLSPGGFSWLAPPVKV